MSNPPKAEVPLATLSSLFKSRQHAYNFLSQIYILPEFESKAITKDYLISYFKDPCPIFRLARDQFHPHFIVTRHVTAAEILNVIEKELKKTNKRPTGLSEDKLPDFQWLVEVYFHLCPLDEHKLFPKTIKQEKITKRTIDPQYGIFPYYLF